VVLYFSTRPACTKQNRAPRKSTDWHSPLHHCARCRFAPSCPAKRPKHDRARAPRRRGSYTRNPFPRACGPCLTARLRLRFDDTVRRPNTSRETRHTYDEVGGMMDTTVRSAMYRHRTLGPAVLVSILVRSSSRSCACVAAPLWRRDVCRTPIRLRLDLESCAYSSSRVARVIWGLPGVGEVQSVLIPSPWQRTGRL